MKDNRSVFGLVALALLVVALALVACGAAQECPPVQVDVQYPADLPDYSALEGLYNVEEDQITVRKLVVQDQGAYFESAINQEHGVENIGGLPTVITANVVTTTTDGALFTVGADEIWFVHKCFAQVTADFDCTGDDCALDLGDGNDADGFLNMADADLQAAATDYTGSPASWQGLDGAAPAGAYTLGGGQVYSATDTIDVDVAGTAIAGGTATIYCVYTRLK